jgi:multidrug efflux pump subunit AcrA (membrane-fusion protein)
MRFKPFKPLKVSPKPLRARLRKWGVILLALCLGFLIQPAELHVQASPSPSLPVQLEYSRLQNPDPAAVSLDGNLEPRQWVSVGFSQGGEIAQLLVKEGDSVQAGQVLARLGDLESLQAALDADQVRLLTAQQALKDLNDGAAHQLATINRTIAQVDRSRALAASKLRSLQKLPDPLAVQQAYGNMKTAEQNLEKKRKELRKAQKLWDPKSFIWRFVPRRAYKLYLMNLESVVAQAEVRYQDSIDAYIKRQKPADPVDVALAQAQLSLAEAQLKKAEQDRQNWLNGPDPDKVAQIKAQIQAAKSALVADQARLEATQLVAPISGTVVSMAVKEGEWAAPNQGVVTIADLSSWQVVMDDVTEDQVVLLKPGMQFTVTFDALPGAKFNGQLESIGRVYVTVHGDTRFTGKADIQGKDPRLRWGMSATLQATGN